MIREKELSIVELTQRLKLGVGCRYGHKSSEYEQARKAGLLPQVLTKLEAFLVHGHDR